MPIFGTGSIEYAAFCARHEEAIREAVEEVLQAKAEETSDPREQHAIRRVLRRQRLLRRVVEKVQAETVPTFLELRSTGAVGADGEFFKWLMDWFSKPENWQTILKFITALIQIFGMFATWLLPLATFLAFAMAGSAAQAQIVCDERYPVYTQIELDVEPIADATYRSVLWEISPAKISGRQLADGRMLFTAPPGKYDIRASVVAGSIEGEKITLAPDGHRLYRATVVIGDAADPDDEPNDDDSTPLPPVVVEGAIVLVVEESASRTVDTAKLLADATFWATVVDRGMRWRVYDVDSPDAAGFAAKVKDILPALIVTDKGGKVLAVEKLPKTKAEVDKIIKRATGK